MLYEFQLVGGSEIISENFRVAEAPDIGATITRHGKCYMRIFSTPHIDSGVKQKVHGYPYVSQSMGDTDGACDTTPEGFNIVRSQNHEREVCSKMGLKRL